MICTYNDKNLSIRNKNIRTTFSSFSWQHRTATPVHSFMNAETSSLKPPSRVRLPTTFPRGKTFRDSPPFHSFTFWYRVRLLHRSPEAIFSLFRVSFKTLFLMFLLKVITTISCTGNAYIRSKKYGFFLLILINKTK